MSQITWQTLTNQSALFQSLLITLLRFDIDSACLPTYLPCTFANEFVISSVNFITNCVLDFTVCCEYKPHESSPSSPSSHHHHHNNNRTISCCFFAAEGDGKRSLKWRIRLKTIDKILSNLKQQKKRFCLSLSLSLIAIPLFLLKFEHSQHIEFRVRYCALPGACVVKLFAVNYGYVIRRKIVGRSVQLKAENYACIVVGRGLWLLHRNYSTIVS